MDPLLVRKAEIPIIVPKMHKTIAIETKISLIKNCIQLV